MFCVVSETRYEEQALKEGSDRASYLMEGPPVFREGNFRVDVPFIPPILHPTRLPYRFSGVYERGTWFS